MERGKRMSRALTFPRDAGRGRIALAIQVRAMALTRNIRRIRGQQPLTPPLSPLKRGEGKSATHHAARAWVQIAIGCSSPRIDCGACATSG